MDGSESNNKQPTLLERLSTLLLREPEDREQLIELLHSAYERNLLDADALSMMEGVIQVSERQVREIMIPRAQMDVIDIGQPPEEFIPYVIETAHSRFPVTDGDKDNIIGILLAKDLLRLLCRRRVRCTRYVATRRVCAGIKATQRAAARLSQQSQPHRASCG
jgi:magnesium and cobalt transporter